MFYSIWKIQNNTNTVSFTKKELEEQFNTDFGSFKDISRYLKNLRTYGMGILNEQTERVIFVNAFSLLEYNDGMFRFEFTQSFLPTLKDQKRFIKYSMTDFSKFNCKYTLYLYDFIRHELWGNKRVKKNLSLKEFKAIFKLDENKYKNRNSNFENKVWSVALKEINTYTNYNISIEKSGQGDKTTFTIIRHEEDKQELPNLIEADTKQFKCYLDKDFIDSNCRDCFRINKCSFRVDKTISNFDKLYLNYVKDNYEYFYYLITYMYMYFWNLNYYNIFLRISNKVATDIEIKYYDFLCDEVAKIKPNYLEQDLLSFDLDCKEIAYNRIADDIHEKFKQYQDNPNFFVSKNYIL